MLAVIDYVILPDYILIATLCYCFGQLCYLLCDAARILMHCTIIENFHFPQIDIIGAMVIVWRARGKIIRSVQYCVQQLYTVNSTHIYEQN